MLLARGINILPAAYQIEQYENLFVDLSHAEGNTHRETSLMTIRYPDVPEDAATNPEAFKKMTDDLFSKPRSPWYMLNAVRPLIYALFEMVEGTHLGGIGIIKMMPGTQVYPHYDTGLSSDFYRRFHIVISGPPECWFLCGEGEDEEKVCQKAGEIWWFDCKKKHAVVNNGAYPRISISVDISSL